jgi:hypothetical protein
MKTTRYNLDTCAMLVEFNASVWTARKLDKGTTDEVISTKSAMAKDAARVNKNLLAGRPELDAINQQIGKVRTFVYDNTLPWSDSGLRLLPTVNFMAFTAKMGEYEEEFNRMVEDFVQTYPTLITAQAMALGDMFKRDEYPTAQAIAEKFRFRVGYMPVPTAGDFRVDVGNEAQAELKQQLEKLQAERVETAMADVRARLGEHLRRMSDRLAVDVINGEVKTRRFHDSLVSGALELCDIVKSLNVVGDTNLEDTRRSLANLLSGVEPDDLRKNMGVRTDVRAQVDQLLDKFAF